ncbi:MAG: hypothetical protein KF753_18400 [Caldilineaceae bacterium]|nr:hypothetical protein [Caldilineaceae bacterium]
MPVSKRLSLLFIALLVFVMAGCSALGFGSKSGVSTPERTVAVSAESATEAQRLIAEARTSNQLRLTEAQFTSLLAEQLAAGGADSPVENLTVWFEPGEVVMRGQMKEGVLPVSGELILSGELAANDGELEIAVKEAKMAGVKVPGPLIGTLNATLNAALAQADVARARIKTISLTTGVIDIVRE